MRKKQHSGNLWAQSVLPWHTVCCPITECTAQAQSALPRHRVCCPDTECAAHVLSPTYASCCICSHLWVLLSACALVCMCSHLHVLPSVCVLPSGCAFICMCSHPYVLSSLCFLICVCSHLHVLSSTCVFNTISNTYFTDENEPNRSCNGFSMSSELLFLYLLLAVAGCLNFVVLIPTCSYTYTDSSPG